MADALNQSVRVRIYGRVQGVWFRAWTVREAIGRVARFLALYRKRHGT